MFLFSFAETVRLCVRVICAPKVARGTEGDVSGGPERELQRLIGTWWAWRYNACKTVRYRLPAIIRLLKDISDERNGDRAIEARDLLAQIDLKFVGLVTMHQYFW